MRKLYTIGYEGMELHSFIGTLKAYDVDILLDVRELPASRKRGFSKSALRAALEAEGIEYRHEKPLGTPKAIRHQVRIDGDYKRFFRAFGRHLAKQDDVLERLAKELKGNVALMCWEHDYTTCHRLPVSKRFEDLTGKRPIHL